MRSLAWVYPMVSSKSRRSRRGQSITEYGALIAFVCVLIAMAFMLRGSLFPPISQSYSSAGNSLDQMNIGAVKANP